MLGEALASILRSRLGQYLDTQDLEVNVAFGREIVLKNVKLKESALRDAGLPLRWPYYAERVGGHTNFFSAPSPFFERNQFSMACLFYFTSDFYSFSVIGNMTCRYMILKLKITFLWY